MNRKGKDLYDPGFVRGLLENDLAWLADARARKGADEGEAAWSLFAHMGRFARAGGEKLPADADREAGSGETARLAARWLDAAEFRRMVETFLDEAPEEDPDELQEEVEDLVMQRDEIEIGLFALGRHSADDEVRACVARSRIELLQADERMKEDLPEFFMAVPLLRGLGELFDCGSLDRRRWWWWFRITEAWDRLQQASAEELLGLPAETRRPEAEPGPQRRRGRPKVEFTVPEPKRDTEILEPVTCEPGTRYSRWEARPSIDLTAAVEVMKSWASARLAAAETAIPPEMLLLVIPSATIRGAGASFSLFFDVKSEKRVARVVLEDSKTGERSEVLDGGVVAFSKTGLSYPIESGETCIPAEEFVNSVPGRIELRAKGGGVLLAWEFPKEPPR